MRHVDDTSRRLSLKFIFLEPCSSTVPFPFIFWHTLSNESRLGTERIRQVSPRLLVV